MMNLIAMIIHPQVIQMFHHFLDESNPDINESHDNNELLGGIADGGLASFVKSSTDG